MAKPAIITVDDEPAVLNAIERDLRQKYGRDYRILKADSGAAALDALKQLQARGEVVALFLSDHRMPTMNGTQFLDQARGIFPDAKKVLLTAYADTEAAISSINQIGLNYYLMKPWDPPSENLYPVARRFARRMESECKIAVRRHSAWRARCGHPNRIRSKIFWRGI